jgi:hypothetical protein
MILRKLWKRLTIRSRAHAFGCRRWEKEFPGHSFHLLSIFREELKPGAFENKRRHVMRTLIRVTNIKNGIPPFKTTCGWLGDTYHTTAAMEAFGNINVPPKPEKSEQSFADRLGGTLQSLGDTMLEAAIYASSRPECRRLRWAPYQVNLAVDSLPPPKQ